MGGAYDGGVYYSWMNWWITGRAPSLTGDVFCMCSREVFREFGTPYFRKIIEHFGSGWFHVHNLGLHLMPEIVRIPGLVAIEVSDDPNVAERGFKAIDWIKAVVGDIPVQITCRPEEFVKGLTRIVPLLEHVGPGCKLPVGKLFYIRLQLIDPGNCLLEAFNLPALPKTESFLYSLQQKTTILLLLL